MLARASGAGAPCLMQVDQYELENSLQSAVAALFQDGMAQAAAVNTLADLVDVQREAAVAVGQAVRDFGAIGPLLELLDRQETQQDALRVIGNLASNAVDKQADETKRLLHEFDAFPRVLHLINSPQPSTIVYALGALQNMLVRPEYALMMRDRAADARLRQCSRLHPMRLCGCESCLSNMKAVLAPNFSAASAMAARGTPRGRRPAALAR